MLGFTAAMAIGTCLLFGLLPALRATRIAPAAAMRAGGRGMTAGRERHGLRRALVTAQVALSLVLLVGALLFVRSLQKLLDVQPGFRPEGIVALNINIGPGNYPKERRPVVYEEILQRLRAHAGGVIGGAGQYDADQRVGMERGRAARRVYGRDQEFLIQPLRAGLSEDHGDGAAGGPRFQ